MTSITSPAGQTEVKVMSIMMNEKGWENMPKMTRKLTEEEKEKAKKLAEIMKNTTYEERRKTRMEEDRKNGFM